MTRVLSSLVVLALGAWAVVVEASHIRAWWLRGVAEEAYNSGDLRATLDTYERVVRLRPREPRSYTDPADSISQYLGGTGQELPLDAFETLAEEAVRDYLTALDAGPPAAWSYARLALLADELGRARSKNVGIDLTRLQGDVGSLTPEDRLCEAAWAKAVEIEPRNFYYRDFFGDYYLRRGFFDRALAHFRISVRLYPVLDGHYFLSDFVSVSDRVLEAVEQGVRDSLDDPKTEVNEYDIHRFLAALYQRLNRLDDARLSLEAAARVAPLPHTVDVQIGRLLLETGDDRGALEAFERAVERQPDYGPAWLSLAATSSRLGDHERAVDAAYRARGLMLGAYNASVTLANVLASAGRPLEAAEVLEQVLLGHPERPGPYGQLIAIYEGQGRLSEATRIARRLHELFPDERAYEEQYRQLEKALGER